MPGNPILTQAGWRNYLKVQYHLGRKFKLISGNDIGPDRRPLRGNFLEVHEGVLHLAVPYLHAFISTNICVNLVCILQEDTRTVKCFVEWIETGDYTIKENSFYGMNPLMYHARIYNMASVHMAHELEAVAAMHIHRLLLERNDDVLPHHDIELMLYLGQHHNKGPNHLREIMAKKIANRIGRYVGLPQFKELFEKCPKVALEIMQHVRPGTNNPIVPMVFNREIIPVDSPFKRAIQYTLTRNGLEEELDE